MPPRDTIIIQKIPRTDNRIDHPQSFNRFEQLYLELIENKTKIKQDLVNKDYIPTISASPAPDHSRSRSNSPAPSPSTSDSLERFKLTKHTKYTPDSNLSDADKDRLEKLEQMNLDYRGSDPDPETDKPEFNFENFENFESKPHDAKVELDEHEVHEEVQSEKYEKPPSIRTEATPKPSQASLNLSNKLQELLNKNPAPPTRPTYTEKYTAPDQDKRFEEYQRSRKRLPTLSELEQQGTVVRKEIADASRLSIEDEDLKRELLFKFDLLRKSYKEQTIPTFTIHSDYKMMQRSYEDTVRRLSLDTSVDSYKRYLIGAFMLIEYAFGRWLKFDMKGYTQQQIVSMSSYEKLLIEIGEKAYMPEGEQWPVEARLVFLVIINTAFFLVGKMIMSKTGSNLMGAINNLNTAAPAAAAPPKRKMQGPSINIDDLPDVAEMATENK
jgi:hypothetical protein